MEERNYIDLAQLQEYIKEGIQQAFPGKFWVKAEISSWSPRANGHCYLSLCQTEKGRQVAEMRAMIWKWHYPQLKAFFENETGQALQAGLTVLVRAQVNYSELYGISLFIDDIDPAFTTGEKALERKRIIERLTQRGYMDMQKELALPDLPRRLAVISSQTAAGFGDFKKHLLENEKGYAFVLRFYEALMQGEKAPESIMEAISEVQSREYDALLILRGGGSEQDLACFDDEDLAMAIAQCPIPVITAIGHERDFHIADMVAMQYVKTPTALADLFIDAVGRVDDGIDKLSGRISLALRKRIQGMELAVQGKDAAIQRGVQQRIHQARQRLESCFGRIRVGFQKRVGALEGPLQRSMGRITKALSRKISDAIRLMDASAHRIRFAMQAKLSEGISALALKEALIRSSDPRNILQMGYVLVTGKDNKVLKTVDRVNIGDRIGVRFSDGSLTARVDNVISETKDKSNIA